MDLIKLDDYEPSGRDEMTFTGRLINANAHAKGFYDEPRSFAEAVALIHSEVSEALEEDRAGRIGLWFQRADGRRFFPNEVYIDPNTLLVYPFEDSVAAKEAPLKLEGRDVELVDAVIRLFDTLIENGANIDLLVRMKHAYNLSRPAKHGKRY